ncbi:MAG: tyrosine-type recombinase/integrase [Dehalococcoidia bacterium]|nr:tyrosine-type recombinase/integrase [Dehalococcoidia bacterium]
MNPCLCSMGLRPGVEATPRGMRLRYHLTIPHPCNGSGGTIIAARSGVKVIRFHDARHTHASLMLKQGVHPKIVQERLGHATIAVTLDTYSHVAPGL